MQYASLQFNRRARERLHRATGTLALAVWLLISTAEVCPPLHEWLHGGSVPDDDDCAVVAVAVGHFHSVACNIPTVATVTWIEIAAPKIEFPVFSPAIENLPNSRAPPALSSVA